MRIVRAEEVERLSRSAAEKDQPIVPQWWEGRYDDGRLNAGLVTVKPGAVTPRHTHQGGQVMIVTAGRGFVEDAGERFDVGAGDVVITPAGEVHAHGAADDQPFAHPNLTSGGYSFPADVSEADGR
jgi:quercetin dioxygenase-like cupin family protein